VGGYFNWVLSSLHNKNIIHIDSYDWQNEIGPDAMVPYWIESIVAHEFEHLVYFDEHPSCCFNSNYDHWHDEGLADLSAYLCGYGHPAGHISGYLAFHSITPLTTWSFELAAEVTGASYLFMLYLYEKFGGEEFITALFHQDSTGIEAIETTLADFGYDGDFNTIFDRWTIANYYDDVSDCSTSCPYGYETLNIGSNDTFGATIPLALDYWQEPIEEAPFKTHSTMIPDPYSVHYHRFYNSEDAMVCVNGDVPIGTVLVHSGTMTSGNANALNIEEVAIVSSKTAEQVPKNYMIDVGGP